MDSSLITQVKQRYGIVGNNEALLRAIDIALKIAPVDLSVLITGENGVGKEVFPRIIHDHSLRRGKKYFAINCGAIPEGTIDSELFGHERGAFTGAIDQREGYFAAANGGTLFLDEVGELPLATQARLLRVLETGEYIRVGSSEVRKTDVRIVAATNVKMEKAIAEGKFREDLFYRLSSVAISVPALRERGDDAALLFRKFALDMSEKYQMPPVRLNPEAQRLLLAYSWPGNVRQLKNLAENMSVTAETRDITPDILSRYLPAESRHRDIVPIGAKTEGHSFENEREILYQILFDLRRDVTELKRIVGQQHYKMQPDDAASLTDHTALASMHADHPLRRDHKNFPLDDMPISEAEEITDAYEATTPPPPPAQPVAPPHDASLDEVERTMIAQALNKHNGRRKAAAVQLGISERTLYRKIKEYGLD